MNTPMSDQDPQSSAPLADHHPENAPQPDAPQPDSAQSDAAAAATPASQQRLREAEKKLAIAQADLENFRKRKNRETAEQIRYASLPLLESLLEVLDNLERALESARNESGASSLAEGVEMVRSQLLASLEAHGCVRIVALGEVFDPNLHEAIRMQGDPAPANTIIFETQPGYKLYDRVIRPAKVIISTGPGSG